MSFVVPALAWVGSALGATEATAAGVGALAIGTGASALGSVMQGEGQSQASEYNAAIARQNAIIAQQQGAAAVQAQQRDASRKIGTMVANYGASGVQTDSGSPLDVLADSAAMATLDSLTLKYNYALKAAGYGSQATLDDMQAKTSSTSGVLGAVGTGLNGLSKGLSMYKDFGGNPIPGFGGYSSSGSPY